jgi:hypothetical protein
LAREDLEAEVEQSPSRCISARRGAYTSSVKAGIDRRELPPDRSPA